MLLLPTDALAGRSVAISVSQTPDLARLGLVEDHFRLALGELTRAVVQGGGNLIYGGRLETDSYTAYMATEVQRYSRRDRPLLICLAWQEHRGLPLSAVEQFRHELGLLGRVVCLDVEGAEVAPESGRGEEPVLVRDVRVRRQALRSLRRYMVGHQDGRVFIGGRRAGFEGSLPGLVEEALLALDAGQAIYLAGGFGGVTVDIARALGIDDGGWLPAYRGAPPDEPGLVEGVRLLRAVAHRDTWRGLRNGLTDQENGWLAVTHRPGEIAALVSRGLGRLGLSGA